MKAGNKRTGKKNPQFFDLERGAWGEIGEPPGTFHSATKGEALLIRLLICSVAVLIQPGLLSAGEVAHVFVYFDKVRQSLSHSRFFKVAWR